MTEIMVIVAATIVAAAGIGASEQWEQSWSSGSTIEAVGTLLQQQEHYCSSGSTVVVTGALL